MRSNLGSRPASTVPSSQSPARPSSTSLTSPAKSFANTLTMTNCSREPLVVFDERVIILFGRIAEVSRIEDLHGCSQPLLEVRLQAFRGRFVVADEQALHVGIAQDDPAKGGGHVGLGTA